jgi:hypothetical protein
LSDCRIVRGQPAFQRHLAALSVESHNAEAGGTGRELILILLRAGVGHGQHRDLVAESVLELAQVFGHARLAVPARLERRPPPQV